MMTTGMAVATPTLIFAWPKTVEAFNLIALDETVHGWKVCRTTTAIKDDGQHWERRCHSKVLRDSADGVQVVFQWFDERPCHAGGC